MLFWLIYLFSINISSENGVFNAEVDYTGGTQYYTENFVLYKGETILYAKQGILAHTFYINNAGTVFAISDHYLYLYDLHGEVSILQNLVYPNGFGFTEDNSVFYASDKSALNIYSQAGELVYQLKPCRLFAGIEEGKFIVTVSNDTLFFFENGIEVATKLLSTPYVQNLEVLQDDKCIKLELPGSTELIEFPTRREGEE